MRLIPIATTALALCAAAGSAMAQVDRYGGVGTYAQPVPQPQSSRVLSWGGKTIPPQSPPQYGGYGYPRYVQSRPAYGAQLQPAPYAQSRGAPPAPYAAERRATMYPPQGQGAPQYPPQYAPQGATQYAPQGAPQYAPQAQSAPQYAPQYAPQPQNPYAYAAQMPPPQQPYYAPRAAQPQAPAAAPQPPQQQAQATFTQPFQPQPYFAPAPGAPAPPPGSTATAPTGVYPTNTVPPQLAGPGSLPPQIAQPLVNTPQAAPPPTSIYAPPPSARIDPPTSLPNVQPDPTDPRQPQRVAMNTAAPPTARYYSLHRQFGLQPDPTPAPPSTAESQTVELVSSIDSGVGAEPEREPRNRVIQTKGKSGTAILRGPRDADPDDN